MENREIKMSQKEVMRLEIIQRVIGRQVSQVEAGRQLKLTSRQVRNLQYRYLKKGAEGLVSRRRGQPSNNRLAESLRSQAVELIQANYSDFGPTLACEKLLERHGLKLSVESTRKLMMKAGIWEGRKRKGTKTHPRRPRRPQFGELVQIDGSPHDWFEGRGPRCCLHAFVDDATSRILQLRFAPTETVNTYFAAAEEYMSRYGRPVTFYSDRYGIFRVNAKEAESGSGETQFGRAMRQLGIGIICANSAPAKGRVERANRTLQDRLVKEMRLEGISDIPAATAFLPKFIEDYNRRFAIQPASPVDAHRLSLPDRRELRIILSQQHRRKVTKNLELSYNNVIYQILSNTPCYTLRGASVTVCDRVGEVSIRYKHRTLRHKTIDKHNRPAPIVDSKGLGTFRARATTKPRTDHPWRRYACLNNASRSDQVK